MEVGLELRLEPCWTMLVIIAHQKMAHLKPVAFRLVNLSLTVIASASHQTGHDTRSMTWRSIIVGVEEGDDVLEPKLQPCWIMLVIIAYASGVERPGAFRTQISPWLWAQRRAEARWSALVICRTSHQTRRVWHKAFLRWVQAQGCSPDTPGGSKNASAPVGIPLKRSVSGARR